MSLQEDWDEFFQQRPNGGPWDVENNYNPDLSVVNFIREYNPSFLKKCGSDISTNLTFEKNLGLGSSSTLISNLSKISGVNPYTINNKIFIIHFQKMRKIMKRQKGPFKECVEKLKRKDPNYDS